MFVDRKGVVERYSTNTYLNQTARTMIYIVMKKGITNLAEHVPTLRTLHAHVSWFHFLIAAKATTTSQKTNTTTSPSQSSHLGSSPEDSSGDTLA